MANLKYINIPRFKTLNGKKHFLKLSYQCFGKSIHEAPVVLINHALTGNSNVAGFEGWWRPIVGTGKVINTETYSILAFNIPGNGQDKNFSSLIDNYRDFTAGDIAQVFILALKYLRITKLFAVIGG